MAITGGYGLATMHWAQTGGMGDITVTCGFQADDLGVASAAAQAEAIESYWIAGSSPCIASAMTVGWTFVGVSVLINELGILYSGQSYTVTVGTAVDSAPATPAYTPLCVTKYTALSGVQYRGRMYPPMTVSDAENVSPSGAIESVNIGVLRGWYNNVFTEWSSSTHPPALLHNPPKGGGSAPAPTAITSFFVQPNVAIQRRRKNRA